MKTNIIKLEMNGQVVYCKFVGISITSYYVGDMKLIEGATYYQGIDGTYYKQTEPRRINKIAPSELGYLYNTSTSPKKRSKHSRSKSKKRCRFKF